MGRTHTISDHVEKDRGTMYPLNFNLHDGMYPLLRIPVMYKGTNPYFGWIPSYSKARIAEHVRPSYPGYVHNYRIRRKGTATIFSGFYSVMGMSAAFNYLPSSLMGTRSYKMCGEVDVFCIGVVKTNKLPKLTFQDSQLRYVSGRVKIELDPEDVTILISKEKLRKTKYVKEYYTITLRNEILWQLDKLTRHQGVKIEDVPDEYLRNFYSFPESFGTNSVVEMMKIETEIKNGVFSNINSIVA